MAFCVQFIERERERGRVRKLLEREREGGRRRYGERKSSVALLLKATALDIATERESVRVREGGRKSDSERESTSESECERKHSKTRA